MARVKDRVSFVYLERCTVHRDANAITAEDSEGVRHIPSATIGTLLLGPGTRVTHQAMSVLGECGAGVVWVGEHGVRYYAGGRALTRSSALAEAQAVAWANRRTRLDVARAMYRLRFPDEDPAGATRRELLGREGDRVKACYRRESARTGVPWHGRQYVPGDFTVGDPPNQGVTAAAQCMYGVAQAVVAALGCSPSLGFVHSGHELSFVMDVADLYKTDVAIPVAFDVAAAGAEDVGSRTRRAIRDRINEAGLLERCVRDIKHLLLAETADDVADSGEDRVGLQSDRGIQVEAGRNYGSDGDSAELWDVMW
nr:type I-E CRISPR-associated endonuclease Cas1e [Nocardiopsis mwathae]